MDFFGPTWAGYTDAIARNWKAVVGQDDLVLVPGDISWAMKLEDARQDLEWLDVLPGTKLLIRGNHDYWWSSSAKMQKALPPSLRFLHNNVFIWNDVAIGGSRLWDSVEYGFQPFIEFRPNPRAKPPVPENIEEEERIFNRELERLRLSLSQLPAQAKLKIAMTHYPPIGADLKPSRASKILEEFGISICVFGHLHNLKKECLPLFGTARGVRYELTSCDALEFKPLKIV
jgi:predicted phosphohydrolase